MGIESNSLTKPFKNKGEINMTIYEEPKKYLRNKIMTDITALIDEIECIIIKAIRNDDNLGSLMGLSAMEVRLKSVEKAIREMDELNTFASKYYTMRTMHEVWERVRLKSVEPYIGTKVRASIDNVILNMMEIFDCI